MAHLFKFRARRSRLPSSHQAAVDTMDNKPVARIIDAEGNPMVYKPSKANMIAGGNGITGSTPYDSSENYSQRMGDWQPWLWSPDSEINVFRDRIVSRSRDIVRNDGWASGAIMRTSDNAVGSVFRPISKPDYKALAVHTGNKKFDAVWAAEFSRAVDACYRIWAEDSGHWCDAARRQTMAQMYGLAFRHKMINFNRLGRC